MDDGGEKSSPAKRQFPILGGLPWILFLIFFFKNFWRGIVNRKKT